jgi:hypothetical protein
MRRVKNEVKLRTCNPHHASHLERSYAFECRTGGLGHSCLGHLSDSTCPSSMTLSWWCHPPIVCLLPHITRCGLNDLPYCTTASAAQRVGEDKRSHTTHFHRTEILHMSRSEPRRMKHKSGNRWRCGAVKLHACAFCSPQQLIFRYVPHSNTLPHTTYTRQDNA